MAGGDQKRFLTWNKFKDKMQKRGIFSKKEYQMFDSIIDSILNPTIRQCAKHCRTKCYKNYSYRVGDLP